MATRKPSNPDAVAIHAVAKAANLSSRELMDTIEQWDLGWDATNHMKRLSPEQIKEVEKRLEVKILDTLKEEAAKKAAAKKKKPKKAAAKPRKPAAKSQTDKKAADDKSAKKADDKPAKKSAKPAAKPSDAKKADEKPAEKTAAAKKPAPAKKDADKKEDKAPAKKAAKADDKKARGPKDKKSEREPTREREEAPEPAKLTPEEISARARTILADILDGMGFPHPRISVDVSPNAVRISLAGRGTADIIGQRNASATVDVLEALQLVVQKSLFGNDHRHGPAVAIDVMGFREGRQQELRAMANRMAEYVARTGKVLRVAGMNFIDRRAVHQGLYDNKNVRTESVGYGAMRSLEVSKAERDTRRKDGRDEQSPSDDTHNDDASAKKSRGNKAPKKDASDKKGRSKDAGGKPSADTGDASEE